MFTEFNKISKLSCGKDHLCIINDDGKLKCKDVALGVPKAIVPNKIKTEKNIKSIAAGMNSSSSISTNGMLQFWFNEPQYKADNKLMFNGYSHGSISHGK